MKRAVFALLAMTAVASFSGCCCLDQLLCRPFWCRGCCGGGCCDGGCDGGCDSCGGGGYADGGSGCASCGVASNSSGGGRAIARRPRHAEDDGGQYAAGPPTGGVAYPYYTNRGPRDFLAKNPPSIGP